MSANDGRRWAAGIPIIADGERYDALCVVIPDRVDQPAAIDLVSQTAKDRMRIRAGASRARGTNVWVTTHYPVEARTRYAEVCQMLGTQPDPDTAEQLTNTRSMLVIAWCIRRDGSTR